MRKTTKVPDMDYFVRVTKFPNRAVDAIVMPNDDATYSIYINEALDQQQRMEAYLHELEHINRDDMYDYDTPVSEMEARIK